MKIALIGYGRMGKEIEKIAIERGHEIIFKFDIDNIEDFTVDNLRKTDVAIEFTSPSAAVDNYLKCFEAGTPVVSGTTGWTDKFDFVAKKCKQKNATFFYASNFSIGVNIFFKINAFLAKIMNNYPEYEVQITEIHHTKKLDSPSGTAVTIANQIIDNMERKSAWKETTDAVDSNILKITSIRQGDVKGTHIIDYVSDIDNITIKHEAKSRKGFALGAVLAAEYSIGKKGILSMDDLLA